VERKQGPDRPTSYATATAISADLTRRDNQNFRLRAPFFAAIITAARHQILIQIDHRFGDVMNVNIAEYYVPVNADVYDIKVIFLDDPDDSNPLGVKGLGEIGIVGFAAAIANSVYHATGKKASARPADHARQGDRRGLRLCAGRKGPGSRRSHCRRDAGIQRGSLRGPDALRAALRTR
jgi:hypothetical protein